MILREFDPVGDDAARLRAFTCSTGTLFEDEVQIWIRSASAAWFNDVPRSAFQRRVLALIEDDAGSLVAVAAWQDIIRVDLDGIWLEVLAVATEHQHSGNGNRAYGLVVDRQRADGRGGESVAGLVHPDNGRSKRLLTAVGWEQIDHLDDHELWLGRI